MKTAIAGLNGRRGVVSARGGGGSAGPPARRLRGPWSMPGWDGSLLGDERARIPFIGLAVMFERMRRTTRDPKDGQSSREIVYWQRQAAGTGG